MNGEAIGSQPLGEASLRRRITEQGGPRPAGARRDETGRAEAERRTAAATRP